MSSKEWVRLVLVLLACNGWWGYAICPVGGRADLLFVLSFLASVAIAIWFIVWAYRDITGLS